MDAYIKYLETENKSPKTITTYIHTVKEFMQWYSESNGEFILQNITPLDVKDFLSWLNTAKKQSTSTINKKAGGLKSYFNYMLNEAELITVDPTAKVKYKKISKLELAPRWLTRSEQARLLHEINKTKNTNKRLRDYAIAQTMLQIGLRVFEVAALNVEDINIRKNILTVRSGKGDKMALLPMNKDLVRALLGYMPVRPDVANESLFISNKGGRYSERGIQYQFRNYFDRANLPDTTLHSLRHTFCKNLLDAGVDLTVVAQLARHESLETTRMYLTPSKTDLMLAVNKISEEDD